MKFKFDWQALKKTLIEQLKGAGVKLALKKLLGSAAMGGFKAWVIKYVVTELFEEIAEPLIKFALQKVGYAWDRHEGKVIIKKINEARENNDAGAYDNATDDVFSSRS